MQDAVIANNTKLVKALLDKGADVNSPNHNDMSLLQVAASSGNTLAKTNDNEMVTILLEGGADVNSRDNAGHTPLFSTKNAEVAKALISTGADVNATNRYGDSPLHSVIDTEIAKALIAAGANVNAINEHGESPLHLVENTEIRKLLIDNLKKNNPGITADQLVEGKNNLKTTAKTSSPSATTINNLNSAQNTNPKRKSIRHRATSMVRRFMNNFSALSVSSPFSTPKPKQNTNKTQGHS